MKVFSCDYNKGFVSLETNSLDDLWVLYNIIDKEDIVSGKTQRKIEIGSEKEKKTIFVKLQVEKVEFHKTSNNLRLNGKIVEGPEDVPIGSYHTLTVGLNTDLTLQKKEFKNYQTDKIKQAVKDTSKPQVLLSVFEPGHADFALLRGWGLDYLGSMNELVEGKEMEEQMEKSKDYFYKQYTKSLEDLSKTHNVQKILVGSISFYSDDFKKYLSPEIEKKVVFTTVSTIGKTGLNEIIKRGAVSKIISDERVSKETEIVEKLMSEIGKEGLGIYGFNEVQKAVEYKAVELLMITDKLISKYKESDTFNFLEEIMKKVESVKGKVEIISSEHDSGKMLDNLGGIAAILRFKIE